MGGNPSFRGENTVSSKRHVISRRNGTSGATRRATRKSSRRASWSACVSQTRVRGASAMGQRSSAASARTVSTLPSSAASHPSGTARTYPLACSRVGGGATSLAEAPAVPAVDTRVSWPTSTAKGSRVMRTSAATSENSADVSNTPSGSSVSRVPCNWATRLSGRRDSASSPVTKACPRPSNVTTGPLSRRSSNVRRARSGS